MPAVEEQVTVSINQSSSNPPTCFALPGNDGAAASWSNVNGTVTLKAMDNEHLYMDCDITITDNVIVNNYPVIFGCRPTTWSWSWGGTSVNVPSGFVQISSATVPVTGSGKGDFTWRITRSNIDLGNISDWGANVDGDDGVLYISGTGNYNVNDPIYPTPYKLVVPGFVKLLDYYPFAVRKGGGWSSCNRQGGGSYIRKGGSWRDLKNARVDSIDSDAFSRSGSSWIKTPLIGSGSE